MNTAEFMAALNTVEQDHSLVLDKMEALKETVSCLADLEGRDRRRGLTRLREINDYFATRFAAHMDEEEATLFPLLEKLMPGGRELVARLRQDHAAIQRKREEFGNCVDFAAELEEGLTKMVVRDLITYGWDLWELLDKHAHEETRAVRQCLAAHLADEPP
jgi:hypothetical protein